MTKIKVGLVTAWGECGMGYIAKNWVYTFNKYPDKINYQIYSRAYPWLSPFRWHGSNIIDGDDYIGFKYLGEKTMSKDTFMRIKDMVVGTTIEKLN